MVFFNFSCYHTLPDIAYRKRHPRVSGNEFYKCLLSVMRVLRR